MHPRVFVLYAPLLVSLGIGSGTAQAINADIEAGPIFSNSAANTTCPSVCGQYYSQWTGNWVTTVQGAMSVCNCSILGPWTIDIEAGPIYSNSDANNKCPGTSNPYGSWNGQWTTTVPGAMSVCGTQFSMSKLGWSDKGLSTDRGYVLPVNSSNPAERCPQSNKSNTQLNGYINFWQCDDEYRDELNMKSSDLNYVTIIKKGTSLSGLDGRYIYVLSEDSNQLLIRSYDRYNYNNPNESYCSQWYSHFTYPDNIRQYDSGTKYLHVRHSQLNNGWNPLWSAGEMQIWNGQVTVINNESGHFKPPAANVQYVVDTLRAYGIPLSSDLKAGEYQSNPAALSESQCGTLLGKDEL